jgi:hypothetical protein
MRDESKLQHKEQPRDSETDAGAFCGDSLRGALEGHIVLLTKERDFNKQLVYAPLGFV